MRKNREAKERYVELVKFLIEKGAIVKIKDKAGNTALSPALGKNQAEIAALIRKAGAKE
jgi:ankyrin repeat protein